MTEETKKLKYIIICLVNGRKKDEDIRRIYNFVVGIVNREIQEEKRNG